MNRVDFMRQLERLLQSIPSAEREEALQYYNDYFDDAGKENEQEVIEALGNPARVAENIKRDLLGSGYGDGPSRSAQESDRALVKYGQVIRSEGQGQSDETADSREEKREYGSESPNGREEKGEYGSLNGWGAQSGEGQSRETAHDKNADRSRMPAWAIALLATALLLGAPVIAGVLLAVAAVLFGALVVWYALIFSFGVASICLFLVLAVLVITGILCLFANVWVGMAMIGSGLICGAVGILFLMLTVAMAGIATPAICKGIALLFKSGKKGLRKCVGRLV